MRHAEQWETPLEIRLMDLITRVLVGVTLSGACLVGVLWFMNQPKFNVVAIDIENESQLQHVDVATLKASSLERLGDNFFFLKLDDVKNMLEAQPWVKHAAVKKVWPYRLSIRVEENQPVAFWGEVGAMTKMLDRDGDIFQIDGQDLRGLQLPQFIGPNESGVEPLMWNFYLRIKPEIEMLGVKIKMLRLSDHGIWSVHLSNGTKVLIGQGEVEELVKRVHDFVSTVPTALRPYEGRALIRADLRHSNGYAMEIDGVQTSVPATSGSRH